MKNREIYPGKVSGSKGILFGHFADKFRLGIHEGQELKCILFVIAMHRDVRLEWL
jgi:hypothetical protein